MSTTPTRYNNSGTTDAPLTDYSEPTFGIDAEGRRHCWSRHHDRIVVESAAGETVHVVSVEETHDVELLAHATDKRFEVPKTVADWVRFVDDEVGWVGTWLDAGTAGEAIARRQAAVDELEGEK